MKSVAGPWVLFCACKELQTLGYLLETLPECSTNLWGPCLYEIVLVGLRRGLYGSSTQICDFKERWKGHQNYLRAFKHPLYKLWRESGKDSAAMLQVAEVDDDLP